jgi:hypothetical protein
MSGCSVSANFGSSQGKTISKLTWSSATSMLPCHMTRANALGLNMSIAVTDESGE